MTEEREGKRPRAEGRIKGRDENARRRTCYEKSCAVGLRDTVDCRGSAGERGEEGSEWDFLNKMERKRHASEYLADSGSVSSASTSKMPSGG